jgi:hypothetical protein
MTPYRHPPPCSSFSHLRKKAIVFVLQIVVLHLLSACAFHQIVGNSNQEKSFDPPHKVVVSTTKNGRVELEKLTDYEGKRSQFAVTYFNKSAASSTFGLENITASDSRGKCIRMYTDQDFIREATDKAASIFNQSYGGYSYDNLVGNLPLNTQQQAIFDSSIESKAGMETEEMIVLGAMIPVKRHVPPNTSTSGLVFLNKTPITIFKITVAGEEYSALFNNE